MCRNCSNTGKDMFGNPCKCPAGRAAVVPVKPAKGEKSPAIICDLDGTLALMQGRGPFEWNRVGEDAPNRVVTDLLRRYVHSHTIIIVSGRSEECRLETIAWLREHGIFHTYLFMRPPGDFRKDAEVKREIYANWIADAYDVAFCLDDRNQSVECWRSLGLTCFQVAPGDF